MEEVLARRDFGGFHRAEADGANVVERGELLRSGVLELPENLQLLLQLLKAVLIPVLPAENHVYVNAPNGEPVVFQADLPEDENGRHDDCVKFQNHRGPEGFQGFERVQPQLRQELLEHCEKGLLRRAVVEERECGVQKGRSVLFEAFLGTEC